MINVEEETMNSVSNSSPGTWILAEVIPVVPSSKEKWIYILVREMGKKEIDAGIKAEKRIA